MTQFVARRPADVARTVDTVITISDLFGGSIGLGTGGTITLRWNRVGRIIDGTIFISIGTTPSLGSGVWAITGSELPAAPYNWGSGTGTEIGGFGAISGNGDMELAAVVYADVGAGSAYGVFFCPPGDGALGNLLSFNTPIPLRAGHTIQSNVHYEAASVA